MDEILIGEKKYISSKQAAKATGYAKDYIGQLCREGRVPARLVGRSWYVLESAIHDHRFGNPKSEPIDTVKPAQAASALPSAWVTPRYESSDDDSLLSVNQLRGRELPEPAHNTDQEVAERLQETWQAWFDRFDHAVGADVIGSIAEAVTPVAKAEDPEKEEQVQSEIINIPIHTVRELAPEEAQEDLMEETELTEEDQEVRKIGRGAMRAMQLSGVLLAAVMTLLAALGSGYFDSYVLSSSQVGLIAGVSLYNK